MTWRVSIRESAERDLRRSRIWYEEKRAGLGDEFLVSVADALARLEANPEQFPIYYRGFRRVLTKTFPYRLLFRIEQDRVIVFRILHAVRDHVRQLK